MFKLALGHTGIFSKEKKIKFPKFMNTLLASLSDLRCSPRISSLPINFFLHIFSSMTELWKLLEEKLLCRLIIYSVLTIAFKFVVLPPTVCDKKSSVKELP